MDITLDRDEEDDDIGLWSVYIGNLCIYTEDYEGRREKNASMRRCMAVISYLNGGERPSFGHWMLDDEY